MAKVEKHMVTSAGLDQLKIELNEKLVKRESLIAEIEDMRSKGDLSENDGYSLALQMNEQNEIRIAELTEMIANAKVVTDSDTKTVGLGNSVEVESEGKSITYEIVGESEADPIQNKISGKSPMGEALMNKKVNDEVEITLPRGVVIYRIIKIS